MSTKINKPALVEELYLMTIFENASKTQVTQFIENFFDIIAAHVTNGDEVTIAGFGKFEKFQKQDGTYKPKFTPFKDFKDAVKGV